MNKDDKRKVKVGVAVAAFAVAFYFVLQSFMSWKVAFNFVAGMISPFILGICFAFVLNILVVIFEKKVFCHIDTKKFPKWKKWQRPVSILLTVIIFLGILTALIAFIIPQLIASAATLSSGLQGYLENTEIFVNDLLIKIGVSTDVRTTLTSFLTGFSDKILQYITNAVPKIVETTASITSGVINVVMGFVIGIYMLSTKESLIYNSKRVIYAYLPKKGADTTTHIYQLVKDRFNGFVAGQLTEAVILGVLCFVGMSIFKMEYALLISIIVGITNIIPIIGPIIGAVPGTVIMFLIDPMKAVWFIVFIVVLQQIECNLIYPKVVGDSIGLPAIWVIFAITVGGGLFGLPGVILGVPAFAVIYTLIAEDTTKRLAKDEISMKQETV